MIVTTRNNRLHSHRAQVRDSASIMQTLFGVRKKYPINCSYCWVFASISESEAPTMLNEYLLENLRTKDSVDLQMQSFVVSNQQWMAHLLTTMMEMVRPNGKCILPINSTCNGLLYEKCKSWSKPYQIVHADSIRNFHFSITIHIDSHFSLSNWWDLPF